MCDVQNGLLSEVIETEGLFYNESNNEIACVEGNVLKPDTPVSMNLWCFHPSILSSLQSLWEEFLEENSHSELLSVFFQYAFQLLWTVMISKYLLFQAGRVDRFN